MENKENSNQIIEKQAFCPECGRNFHLDNVGDSERPNWVMPQHIVRKVIGKSTAQCKGSGLNMN